MRKVAIDLTEHVKAGYVNGNAVTLNAKGCCVVTNAVPDKGELQYLTHLSRFILNSILVSAGITATFATRLLQMENYVVIFNGAQIYSTVYPYSVVTEYTVVNLYDYTEPYVITGVGTWVVSKLGTYWVASNGSDTIYGDFNDVCYGAPVKVGAARAGNYSIVGGFDSTMLSEARSAIVSMADRVLVESLSDRMVWWGNLLSPVWLPFFDANYINSIAPDWDSVKSYAIGDTGFELLDSPVLGVSGTDKFAVAFTSDWTYIGKFIQVESMITIAWQKIWRGLKDRTSFGCNSNEILFIDSAGCLVKITEDGKPALIDYRLWTPASGISIVHDNNTGYWYISNGVTSVVLGQGLGGSSRHYMGLVNVDGVTKGLHVEGSSEDMNCYIEVAPTDFSMEGDKRLVSINIDGTLTTLGKFQTYVKYAQSQSESYVTGATIDTNELGFCGLSVGANRFKLGLISTVGVSNFNRVIVEVENRDSRFVRAWRSNDANS